MSRLVWEVLDKLRNLAVGDWLFLPIGYRKPDGGHAMMFLCTKSSEDKFDVAVINTGGGLEYHPSDATDYPKGTLPQGLFVHAPSTSCCRDQ